MFVSLCVCCCHRAPIPSHLRVQAQVVEDIAMVVAKVMQRHHLQVLASGRRQMVPTRKLHISRAHLPLATPKCRELSVPMVQSVS